MSVYTALQRVVRRAWPLVGPLVVRGVEHVPESGPFILVANHQSILDPILIQAVCPRPLHTMAKSNQFTVPFIGWLMAQHLHSFPARRYEVDPQTVRTALRRLEAGHGVGIYLEGERSWDAKLQPLRLGTVRLILYAGVPVVPTIIHGSYDVWPRWSSRPSRSPITIEFGKPLHLPQLRDRAGREAAVLASREVLQAAIDPARRGA